MILNLIAIRKCLCLKQNITAIIIKPAAAAAVMLFVIRLLKYALCGGIISLAAVCIAACMAYVAVLFITNAVSIGEVRKILKG